MHEDPHDNWQPPNEAPSSLLWPLRRIGWFIEKYVLWPVADSFRRFTDAFRYRSPLAYIGTTLMVTVTAGAVAAALYFYNQTEEKDPVVADAVPAETVVPTVPTPTAVPPTTEDTTPNSGDNRLQGVVPTFAATGKAKKSKQGAGADQQLPANVVRPAPTPKSKPLQVAHRFATVFTSYEIGKKDAAKRFRETATPQLAKELRKDPPRLPASGQVPKATVVNVVRGKKHGDRMDVSVSLMRTGGASELRLGLTREQGKGWLVSQVRG